MTTKEKVLWTIGILAILILAVYYDKRDDQSSSTPVTTTTSTSTTNTTAVACTVVPNGPVTIYQRPSTDAGVFGTIDVGSNQVVTGMTQNGWYAFEPDVAQAGNIGIFRNRYIPASGSFTTTGNCGGLTQIAALPANTCFTTAATQTIVYTSANTNSAPVATLNPGEYLPVISTRGQNSSNPANYFVEVESVASSTPTNVHGWIQGSNVNFNGSDCSTLPVNTSS